MRLKKTSFFNLFFFFFLRIQLILLHFVYILHGGIEGSVPCLLQLFSHLFFKISRCDTYMNDVLIYKRWWVRNLISLEWLVLVIRSRVKYKYVLTIAAKEKLQESYKLYRKYFIWNSSKYGIKNEISNENSFDGVCQGAPYILGA